MDLHPRTRSFLLPPLLGQDDIRTQIEKRFNTMISKCCNKHVKYLLEYHEFNHDTCHFQKNINFVPKQPDVLNNEQNARLSVVRELLDVRDSMSYIENLNLDNSELNAFIDFVCTF